MRRNQEGGWEDTDKGQWPRGLGEIIAIFCSVPGELKEAVPIRSLVGTTKTVTSASEDNVQPHSEVEFFYIFKRPVPKEVTESQVTHATPTLQILLDLYQTTGTELGTAGGL